VFILTGCQTLCHVMIHSSQSSCFGYKVIAFHRILMSIFLIRKNERTSICSCFSINKILCNDEIKRVEVGIISFFNDGVKSLNYGYE
jgi:hypothetical protein